MEFKFLLHLGVFFLAIAFLTFFVVCVKLLFNVKYLTSTVKAMRLFSIAGLITLFLGLFLAFSHISLGMNEHYLSFVNAHILFALFGFTFLLIMGVSFQVIPMFYVSLDFPKFVQNTIPVLLFSLLFVCQNTYSQVDFCNNILASHVTAGKSYTTICFDCTPRIHNFNYTSYCSAATEADF